MPNSCHASPNDNNDNKTVKKMQNKSSQAGKKIVCDLRPTLKQ